MVDTPSPFLQFRQSYYDECAALLNGMREGLDALSDTGAMTFLASVSRVIHSVRGGAAAFGLKDLDAFAALMERAVNKQIERQPEVLGSSLQALLRQCCAMLEQHLSASRTQTPWPSEQDDPLKAALREMAGLPALQHTPASAAKAKPKSGPAIPVDIEVAIAPVPEPAAPRAAQTPRSVSVAQLHWNEAGERPSLLDGHTSLFEGLWRLPELLGQFTAGLKRAAPSKQPAPKNKPFEDDIFSDL